MNTYHNVHRSLTSILDSFLPHINGPLVCAGISGMRLALPLSLHSGYPAVVIRRKDELCHSLDSRQWVDYNWSNPDYDKDYPVRKYNSFIFVDDFIAGGATLERVTEFVSVQKILLHGSKYMDSCARRDTLDTICRILPIHSFTIEFLI